MHVLTPPLVQTVCSVPPLALTLCHQTPLQVHNFPEGLAVGVGFAAVGSSKHATFAAARTLAIGIGLQNFPEGLAVSLPLMRAGYSRGRAFWYGQLSGMVEPLVSEEEEELAQCGTIVWRCMTVCALSRLVSWEHS